MLIMNNKNGARIISSNIVSPLGFTAAENYAAVKAGRSALTRYEEMPTFNTQHTSFNIQHTTHNTPFMASLLDRDKVEQACSQLSLHGAYTYFEKLAILSITEALSQCDIDVESPRTLFILSTTKGNIEMLLSATDGVPRERLTLSAAAVAIAQHFGNSNQPLVVSNACISGLCAQITAMRLLQVGSYDNIIVCGAEVISPFIISGFQSLMALSEDECRPFDVERNGINLGEAAATVIYSSEPATTTGWQALCGAVRNDANHISNPSRTAEGSYRCLQSVMRDIDADDIAFINAHGTATLYNDEMEAKAIDRVGLIAVPVNSLKGYYGHTMGAAGVLETVISMCALSDHTVIGTRGFEELGVSRRLNISAENRPTTKQSFIKLISGFGGCNAAAVFGVE